MKELNVISACDGNMLPGMHAMLYSLLTNQRKADVVAVHLYVSDATEKVKYRLRSTCERAHRPFELQFYDLEASLFARAKSLLGSTMPYALLLFPIQVAAKRVIWLDADMIINTDLWDVYTTEMGSCVAAGSLDGKVSQALDRDVLLESGGGADDRYVNTGFLLIDVEKYRADGVLDDINAVMARYARRLLTADQTLINLVLRGRMVDVPTKYNMQYSCHRTPFDIESDAICHFVGSPKPWDPGGRMLHRSYNTFWRYYQMTAHRSIRPVWSEIGFRRLVHLAPSYMRWMKTRRRYDRRRRTATG